jgi:hypothetical protein
MIARMEIHRQHSLRRHVAVLKIISVVVLVTAMASWAASSLSSAQTDPSAQPPPASANSLDKQWAYLQNLQIADVGADAFVQGYEEFIANAGNDPRKIDAMLLLASTFSTVSIPEKGIAPDAVQALKWYQRAAQTANPETEQWKTAQRAYAMAIVMEDNNAARSLLENVLTRVRPGSGEEVEVELELLYTYKPQEVASADVQARRLLDWYRGHKPSEDWKDKRKADVAISGAAYEIIEKWRTAPLPIQDRIKGIKNLQDAYTQNPDIQSASARAINDLGGEISEGANVYLQQHVKTLQPVATVAPLPDDARPAPSSKIPNPKVSPSLGAQIATPYMGMAAGTASVVLAGVLCWRLIRARDSHAR